jgi:hypothetical protein
VELYIDNPELQRLIIIECYKRILEITLFVCLLLNIQQQIFQAYSGIMDIYLKKIIFSVISSPITLEWQKKVKIVKNERDPPLFIDKLLIKFQNILRNTTQVIIRHRVKILFSVISSPITLEWQK